MFTWIKRQLDKLPTSPGLVMPGKWYVRYTDPSNGPCQGKRSDNVTYDVATNNAKIFGGKVYHVDDQE